MHGRPKAQKVRRGDQCYLVFALDLLQLQLSQPFENKLADFQPEAIEGPTPRVSARRFDRATVRIGHSLAERAGLRRRCDRDPTRSLVLCSP